MRDAAIQATKWVDLHPDQIDKILPIDMGEYMQEVTIDVEVPDTEKVSSQDTPPKSCKRATTTQKTTTTPKPLPSGDQHLVYKTTCKN